MSGKALSLLALLTNLGLISGAVFCQEVKSYNAVTATPAYKQKPVGPHKRGRATARPAHRKAVPVAAPADIAVDPALSYRGLTPDAVLAALRANHFAALEQGADVRFEGDTLKLAIWSPASGGEHKLRVDTVLLAQAIERQFPGVFETFECSFCQSREPGRSRRAQLKTGKIADYARAKITEDELLQAVTMTSERMSTVGELYQDLSYRQILDKSVVLDGAYSAERKELSDELTTLKANGYDVNQATRQFLAMEDLVRTKQYSSITAAFARTRQCIAESVAKAQGVSVASSRTINWQR
jgi:hypothetical protein